jgi:glycosyltransferase involved in cell wall biosynthesis
VRVLAAIIAHPLRKVSGATNAGLQLSEAVSRLIDLDVAIMWDANEVTVSGDLAVRRVKCWNRLGPLTGLAPRMARVPLYDSSIPEIITDGQYDLVHLHNLVPAMAAGRVARACRARGVPYVISTHGFFELTSYARINGFGRIKSAMVDLVQTRPFRGVVRGATRLLALSDREEKLLASLGVAESQIDVVTNGVNEYFLDSPSEAELREVRTKFGLHTTPMLLFMGSLHAYKGVGTFLRSLEWIKPPFQAVVAGKFKSSNEAEELLANAQVSPEVRKRVTFTGEVTNPELRALYRSADLFVYPTKGDTLPLVVLEAMACGLPIVSTTIGGIPYSVPPECGILTEPDDPKATASAVTALLDSPERRAAAGRSARERVVSTFRWEASARRAVAAYGKALEAPANSFEPEFGRGSAGLPGYLR